MIDNLDYYLNIAKESAILAGRLLNSYFGSIKSYTKKDGAGIVTKADTESEALIIDYLSKRTPDFSFLAEESGLDKAKSEYTWVIDPLDGTSNFYHGFPYFNVSIALVREETSLVGVVYDPVLDRMFWATLGGGAYLDGVRLSVSSETELANSLFGTGFAYMRGKELSTAINIFHRFSELSRGIRRPGAAALDLAYTALGVYDGFFEKALNPWDLAAGSLLITEAGGKLSSFTGKQFSIYNKSIVAANPTLHDKMLKVIREELDD